MNSHDNNHERSSHLWVFYILIYSWLNTSQEEREKNESQSNEKSSSVSLHLLAVLTATGLNASNTVEFSLPPTNNKAKNKKNDMV